MSGYITPAGGGGGGGGGIPEPPGGGAAYARIDGLWTNADTRYAAAAHTQAASTITDFSEAVDDRVAALLIASGAVTITYDDAGNTLTIGAAGGGGIPEPPGGGAAYARISGSWTNADTRYAAASHTHAAAAITDFSEAVDDRVAALLVAGTNVTFTYNDAGNTLTIDATGSGGIPDAPNDGVAYVRRNLAWTNADTRFAAASHTQAASTITDFAEVVDDRVAALLVAAGVVTITYDDAGNALTISATGGGGSGDISASAFTMSSPRILGRSSAGTGAIEQATLGEGLAFVGSALSAGPLRHVQTINVASAVAIQEITFPNEDAVWVVLYEDITPASNSGTNVTWYAAFTREGDAGVYNTTAITQARQNWPAGGAPNSGTHNTSAMIMCHIVPAAGDNFTTACYVSGVLSFSNRLASTRRIIEVHGTGLHNFSAALQPLAGRTTAVNAAPHGAINRITGLRFQWNVAGGGTPPINFTGRFRVFRSAA